jgi:hypothetical protein
VAALLDHDSYHLFVSAKRGVGVFRAESWLSTRGVPAAKCACGTERGGDFWSSELPHDSKMVRFKRDVTW